VVEQAERAKLLLSLVSCPGWVVVKNYLEKQAERAQSLRGVNMENDQTILDSVKLAQSRKDIYSGILHWVDEQIKKGGINNA
jgi:hypothetical protein